MSFTGSQLGDTLSFSMWSHEEWAILGTVTVRNPTAATAESKSPLLTYMHRRLFKESGDKKRTTAWKMWIQKKCNL